MDVFICFFYSFTQFYSFIVLHFLYPLHMHKGAEMDEENAEIIQSEEINWWEIQ